MQISYASLAHDRNLEDDEVVLILGSQDWIVLIAITGGEFDQG